MIITLPVFLTIWGFFKFRDVGQNELLEKVTNIIKDQKIRENFILLRKKVDQMISFDLEVAKWLAGYVGMESIETKKEKKELEKRTLEIIAGKPGAMQGQIWITEEGYQQKVRESGEILSSSVAILRSIEKEIDPMVASTERRFY